MGTLERPSPRRWSLRCTGVWLSLAHSARQLVAAAVGSRGRGLGHAKGRVSRMRQRIDALRSLCNRAEHLHCGGPQVQVAVITGNDELGVAGGRPRVLRDGVLGRCTVSLGEQRVAVVEAAWANQNACSVWCPRTCRLSRRHRRGIWLTAFAPTAGTPVARLRSVGCRRWRMTSVSTVWTHGLRVPYCRGGEVATPSPWGTLPEMATAHMRVRLSATATLVTCLQGTPPDVSEDVWPQVSGIR